MRWPSQWLRGSRAAKVTAGVVLLASVGMTMAGQSWLISASPQDIRIEDVAIGADVTGDRWLTVSMTAPPQRRCYRIGLHMLYRDEAERRHYVPLSPALNGMAFAYMATSFRVSMAIPANVAAGEWRYVQRTLFTCPLWPYGVRMAVQQTEPRIVTLPAADFSAVAR